MLHDTISGYDGFFDNATGNNLPDANALKNRYNIPNALNIYTTDCLGIGSGDNTCISGKNGFSPYLKDLSSNKPGIFVIHRDMPGSYDTGDPNISTLAHEIGHSFDLQHINGKWFFKDRKPPRELVNDDESCNEMGDLICDTPGSPGDESRAWDINTSTGECIYHGYGGEYDENTGILKIGGYDKLSPTPINYNYCSAW